MPCDGVLGASFHRLASEQVAEPEHGKDLEYHPWHCQRHQRGRRPVSAAVGVPRTLDSLSGRAICRSLLQTETPIDRRNEIQKGWVGPWVPDSRPAREGEAGIVDQDRGC